ncbi:c-type cytochrome biogenesis protein CcsB [Alkalicoccobacillus plakortidis]|uniref:C-type cytochrome biogenesis protein CcsB n=1 Tax=Alkalicoccobacillus plakortidis TaxID=444060 RepID=A0ABT0XNW3_9BACI|nr:c-type cytochrome biogenesis protein CcsB [Alkalicoccobacillus plakortidis]MCM2677527.1 c-type cytochrome biogenesis protein CcsB [Alkalicoccobacillus plakortidis]
MSTESLLQLSESVLFISFFIYLVAIIPLGLSIKSKKRVYSYAGISLTLIGFILQLIYFGARWSVAGHAPVSNLYEFMTFFGIMLIAGFLLIFFMYRQTIIGLFTIPLSLIILGYASAFSSEVSPLIPALQSNWLTIHVMTVAFASAVLSIAFVTSVLYLLKTSVPDKKNKSNFFLELVMYALVVVCGFIISTTFFGMVGEEHAFQFQNKDDVTEIYEYTMYPITVPNQSEVINDGSQTGLVELPVYIDSHKVNTLLWSFIIGTILYILMRLITRRKVITLLKPITNKLDASLMDEISHRTIVIGFPLFALGGLVFAMIWAQMAWTRFWGWDPKEVWALITFLVYAVYLHLRLNDKWTPQKAAWVSIIGFATIIFNQVFVNLVIAGLHSYA